MSQEITSFELGTLSWYTYGKTDFLQNLEEKKKSVLYFEENKVHLPENTQRIPKNITPNRRRSGENRSHHRKSHEKNRRQK